MVLSLIFLYDSETSDKNPDSYIAWQSQDERIGANEQSMMLILILLDDSATSDKNPDSDIELPQQPMILNPDG